MASRPRRHMLARRDQLALSLSEGLPITPTGSSYLFRDTVYQDWKRMLARAPGTPFGLLDINSSDN